MSCSSVVAKDFMKIDNTTLSLDHAQNEVLDPQKKNLKSSKDMTQTLDLFRKYFFAKTPQNFGKTNEEESNDIKRAQNFGKTNEEESNDIKRAQRRPLVLSKFNDGFRPPSFLEKSLLSEMSGNATLPSSSSGEKASPAQLTIFYGGVINVYDDVPFHKAQAIMLLAGGNSMSAPIASNVPKTDVKKPLHPPNLPSVCKLQAELPIARKYSLQRFLEKRGRRALNKSPYAYYSDTKHDDQDQDEPTTATTTHDLMMNERGGNFTPSPFPTRLGYSLHVPTTNKGCY